MNTQRKRIHHGVNGKIKKERMTKLTENSRMKEIQQIRKKKRKDDIAIKKRWSMDNGAMTEIKGRVKIYRVPGPGPSTGGRRLFFEKK